MKYETLSQDSKDYIDRYIRGTNKTRESALKELIIQNVINEYEKGDNS